MSNTQTEPTVNDLNPMLAEGVEKEPMLLLDITGSMSYAVADGSALSRWSVITEALGGVVTTLAAKDSQAAKEAAAGEDAGGLMTYTFAGGKGEEIGDLSPANWQEKIHKLKLGGNTVIMPGWNALVDGYMQEFGDRPQQDRPNLLALVITDGEAEDTNEFAQTLSQQQGGTYVCIAILGYGEEHDRALAAYQKVAADNKHVRVVTFAEVTDPQTIANGLISLIGN